jgi:hypothetical protein
MASGVDSGSGASANAPLPRRFPANCVGAEERHKTAGT